MRGRTRGHQIVLIERVKSAEERLWYVRQDIQNGWSRAVLVHQIESGLYQRQGKALSNFDRTFRPRNRHWLVRFSGIHTTSISSPSVLNS